MRVRPSDLRASIFFAAIRRVSVRLDTEIKAAALRGDSARGSRDSAGVLMAHASYRLGSGLPGPRCARREPTGQAVNDREQATIPQPLPCQYQAKTGSDGTIKVQ